MTWIHGLFCFSSMIFLQIVINEQQTVKVLTENNLIDHWCGRYHSKSCILATGSLSLQASQRACLYCGASAEIWSACFPVPKQSPSCHSYRFLLSHLLAIEVSPLVGSPPVPSPGAGSLRHQGGWPKFLQTGYDWSTLGINHYIR